MNESRALINTTSTLDGTLLGGEDGVLTLPRNSALRLCAQDVPLKENKEKSDKEETERATKKTEGVTKKRQKESLG